MYLDSGIQVLLDEEMMRLEQEEMVERYSRLMADYRRKESQLSIALNDLGKAERKIKELSRKLLKEGGKAMQYEERIEEARQALEQQEEQFIQTVKLITAEKEAAQNQNQIFKEELIKTKLSLEECRSALAELKIGKENSFAQQSSYEDELKEKDAKIAKLKFKNADLQLKLKIQVQQNIKLEGRAIELESRLKARI